MRVIRPVMKPVLMVITATRVPHKIKVRREPICLAKYPPNNWPMK